MTSSGSYDQAAECKRRNQADSGSGQRLPLHPLDGSGHGCLRQCCGCRGNQYRQKDWNSGFQNHLQKRHLEGRRRAPRFQGPHSRPLLARMGRSAGE